MNGNELIFCTQPTEMFAAPQVERGGRYFAPNEQAKRDASLALVEGVRTTGELVYEYEAVQFIADHRLFLFEVPSKDASTGEAAPPIVCVGTFEWGNSEKLLSLVNEGFERYASASGRTISLADLSHFCPAFDRLGPKHQQRLSQVNSTVKLVMLGITFVFLIIWSMLTAR